MKKVKHCQIQFAPHFHLLSVRLGAHDCSGEVTREKKEDEEGD
jgi:hypothetical protein